MLPCTLDIETGGLDKQGDPISLIGAFSPKQMLIWEFPSAPSTHSESFERAFNLAQFKSIFPAQSHFLVTFNGLDFDLPFLQEKSFPLTEYVHLDLLQVAKANIHIPGSFRKDDLCRLLGIYVPRTMEGRGCALAVKSPKLFGEIPLLGVFEHNSVDLCATMRLYLKFKEAGWLDEFLANLNNSKSITGNPVKQGQVN